MLRESCSMSAGQSLISSPFYLIMRSLPINKQPEADLWKCLMESAVNLFSLVCSLCNGMTRDDRIADTECFINRNLHMNLSIVLLFISFIRRKLFSWKKYSCNFYSLPTCFIMSHAPNGFNTWLRWCSNWSDVVRCRDLISFTKHNTNHTFYTVYPLWSILIRKRCHGFLT